jgi:hypothetical protein
MADHHRWQAGLDGAAERHQVGRVELVAGLGLHRQGQVAVRGHRPVAREVLDHR